MKRDHPDEITFQIWPLKVVAKGTMAVLIVTPLLAASALLMLWRILFG